MTYYRNNIQQHSSNVNNRSNDIANLNCLSSSYVPPNAQLSYVPQNRSLNNNSLNPHSTQNSSNSAKNTHSLANSMNYPNNFCNYNLNFPLIQHQQSNLNHRPTCPHSQSSNQHIHSGNHFINFSSANDSSNNLRHPTSVNQILQSTAASSPCMNQNNVSHRFAPNQRNVSSTSILPSQTNCLHGTTTHETIQTNPLQNTSQSRIHSRYANLYANQQNRAELERRQMFMRRYYFRELLN